MPDKNLMNAPIKFCAKFACTEPEIIAVKTAQISHAEAVAKGDLVDVGRAAFASGFPIQMFLTRAVFETYVATPNNVEGPIEVKRLQMFFFMLRRAYRRLPHPPDLIPFDNFEIFSPDGPPIGSRVPVNFKTPFYSQDHKLEEVRLVAVCSMLDIDGEPQPAITVMMQTEEN